jgi:hypothetical protein
MKKNISIHQVKSNDSPIRKLKLQPSAGKSCQFTTYSDKYNPV